MRSLLREARERTHASRGGDEGTQHVVGQRGVDFILAPAPARGIPRAQVVAAVAALVGIGIFEPGR